MTRVRKIGDAVGPFHGHVWMIHFGRLWIHVRTGHLRAALRGGLSVRWRRP